MLSTVFPYIALVIAVGSLGISFVAMQFALRNKRDERNYRKLLLWMQEIDDQHEALSASHKRLRSRIGMRELRERKKGAQNGSGEPADPEPGTPEWKQAMRLKLQSGEIKPR